MKSIFAGAIIAAAAMANNLAIPDYTAGFVYGMTGANHLDEIEACYTGSVNLEKDAKNALEEIKSGTWTKGILDLQKVMNEFPDALSTCKGMDDDIAKIQDWAKIFTEPKKLFKTAGKNYLLHRGTVHDDIANEQAHWASGEYFHAGIDTAMAITEILPIEDSSALFENDIELQPLGMPVLAAPKFGAGLVFGLVGDNNLNEIETCAKDAHHLIPVIEQVLQDFEAGLITHAVIELHELIVELKTTVTDCRHMSDDITRIEDWAQIFQDKAKLVAIATKNFALHKKAVKADIADAKAAWALGEYFSAGVTCADIVDKVVGPIK